MTEIWSYIPLMIEGLEKTVGLFFVTLIFSIPLGLPIALGEESKNIIVSTIFKVYVWLFRGTPLVLQLFFFYYFFPIALNINGLDAFTTACLTFVLNYAAYFAEIYRGGMNSIHKGQHDAAFALGLSKRQTLFGIILPQTMKVILPPVFNETITLVKDTALIMVIGVADMMKVTNGIVSRTSQLTPLFVAAVIYLIMTFILTIFAGRLEKYFSRYDARGE